MCWSLKTLLGPNASYRDPLSQHLLKIYLTLTHLAGNLPRLPGMRRAFVIQLLHNQPGDRCQGRIEHVDSGRSSHFRRLSEVVSFVRNIESELGEPLGRHGVAITEQDVAATIEDDCN